MKRQAIQTAQITRSASSWSLGGIFFRFLAVIIFIVLFAPPTTWSNGNEKLAVTLPAFSGRYETAVVSMGTFGLRGEASSVMKIPEDASIVAGFIYLSGYSNLTPAQLGNITAVFSNTDGDSVTVTAQLIGHSTESKNQYFTYRADVSPYIATGEHTYRLQSHQLPAQPTRGRLHGGGMVVIYSLPSFPEVSIWIADGSDYFNASEGQPTTKTVVFPFDTEGVDRYATVRLFAGSDVQNAASGLWYKTNNGSIPTGDIMDTADAVDYNHSSSSDPNVDTDPLTRQPGPGARWGQVEFLIPIAAEDAWAAFQLESQTDFSDRTPFSGLWNMVAIKVPNEATGCGSIGDQVFYDKNADGVKSSFGERGIPTVKVALYADNGDGIFQADKDALVDTTTTNRLGYYQFLNLEFGTYFVDIDHPYLSSDSAKVTTQNDPTPAIKLSDCKPKMDVDFGITAAGRPSKPTKINNFTAFRNKNSVTVNWSAVSGTENLGFDIYRSNSENGDYERLNEEVIPASQETANVHEYAYEDYTTEANTDYYYKLANVDLEGNSSMYGPVSTATTMDVDWPDGSSPENYALGPAYPNPFNPSTLIQFKMKNTGRVTIAVFNILGQNVRTLLAQEIGAGVHQIAWDGKDDRGQDLPAGLYFYQMSARDFRSSKCVLYLK